MERAIWILSTHACARMVYTVQELTQVLFNTSEQHKDIAVYRKQRDFQDAIKVFEFISCRSPFDAADSSLRNLFTGEIAEKNVDVHCALEVGKRIEEQMCGVAIFDYQLDTKLKAIHECQVNGIHN